MEREQKVAQAKIREYVKITHNIGNRLLGWILLFSFLITLVSTMLQLYLDYRRDVGIIEERLGQIEESYLESLIDSLWVFNQRQMLVQLEGILRLPDMRYVEIRLKDNEVIASVGVKQERNTIFQEYRMNYFYKNENISLGTLKVMASLEGIYRRLIERGLLILANQGVKIFLVALFILILFHYLVTRHLSHLAEQAMGFDIRDAGKKFTLQRKKRDGAKRDELDEVLAAMNIMQGNLKNSYEKLEGINQQLQLDIQERSVVEQKLRDSEENLEAEVLRRTEELNHAVQKLENQHTELKEKQGQLIQTEKMAALGTVVAGVAYEINDPVNFMHGSMKNLSRNLKEFKIWLYDLAGEDAEEDILQYFEENFERFNRNLSDIEEGGDRIKSIVIDLRSFSRLDDAERKKESVVKGIKSTLRLIQVKYKNEVEFISDFKADPTIEGWHAQLNQVFMNIMVNACQAICSKVEKDKNGNLGQLKINTELEGKYLSVRFQDNGCGMEPEQKKKVFEPFYSTKTVGEGTGLGLSISFGIIEKHQGQIIVDSTIGVGSTFKVLIPLNFAGSING